MGGTSTDIVLEYGPTAKEEGWGGKSDDLKEGEEELG